MIYIFLAEGFEEIEALAPLDILRRADIPVVTVGVGAEEITGSHNISVKTDISLDEVKMEDIDGVILPGGMPGTLNLQADAKVMECVRYAYDNNKLLGAIPHGLSGQGGFQDHQDPVPHHHHHHCRSGCTRIRISGGLPYVR